MKTVILYFIFVCMDQIHLLRFVFILTLDLIRLIRAKKKSELHHLVFRDVKGAKHESQRC